MTIELTNQEKIDIIKSRIKNLLFNKYNLELSLKEVTAVNSEEDGIVTINKQISNLITQIQILDQEMSALQ